CHKRFDTTAMPPPVGWSVMAASSGLRTIWSRSDGCVSRQCLTPFSCDDQVLRSVVDEDPVEREVGRARRHTGTALRHQAAARSFQHLAHEGCVRITYVANGGHSGTEETLPLDALAAVQHGGSRGAGVGQKWRASMLAGQTDGKQASACALS